jgi:hypothetical protein
MYEYSGYYSSLGKGGLSLVLITFPSILQLFKNAKFKLKSFLILEY